MDKDEMLAMLLEMGFTATTSEPAVRECTRFEDALERAMVLTVLEQETTKATKQLEQVKSAPKDHHPDVAMLRRMFQTNLIVESSPVKLYSTTTKSNAFMLEQERRAMHLIQTKGVKFELIFLDLRTEAQSVVEAISGKTELPQLHINNKYFGNIAKLQEMEDGGQLYDLLIKEGIIKPRRSSAISEHSASDCSVTTKAGALSAKATSGFIHLAWGDCVGLFPQTNVTWVLLMDNEAVYAGGDFEYLVESPGKGVHRFRLHAVDDNKQFLSARFPDKLNVDLMIQAPQD